MQLIQKHFAESQTNPIANYTEIKAPLASKSYKQTFHPTLKHSNATQNIYFSNYIEWQGMVRERWFFECVDEQMLQNRGVFVTKMVHQDYFKEGFPFQEIVCMLNTFDVHRCSFNLMFRFYCADKLISSGYQKIAFTNHNKKVTRLPQSILDRIRTFEKAELEFN